MHLSNNAKAARPALHFLDVGPNEVASLVPLRIDGEAISSYRPEFIVLRGKGLPQRGDADLPTGIGICSIPGPFRTIRRSTPVPSKGTSRLAMLIPDGDAISNLEGCLSGYCG